jgi:hypothetical protein
MALWPPIFLSSDKSSLSAGVIKVSDAHCTMKIKNSHEQERVESTELSWRQMSGMFSRHFADG